MRNRPAVKADVRRDAMRALYEGAEATPELLAAVADLLPDTIALWAEQDCWEAACPNPREARARRLIDAATERLSQIRFADGDDAKAVQDRIRTETLGIGALEKLARAARSIPARREAEKAENERIGTILERLNRRIVELAREYAKELAEQRAPRS